jgi:hypothetical protein
MEPPGNAIKDAVAPLPGELHGEFAKVVDTASLLVRL